MEIAPFKKDYLPDMAEIFVQNYRKLRSNVAILPESMEDTDHVVAMLTSLLDNCPGVVALNAGKLLGYMGWYVVDHFRGTDWTAAYCPEWGHGTLQGENPEIYRVMYREAAKHWVDSGCQVHALTLLAHDRDAEKVWFWNGFGLAVIDAIRPMQPLESSLPTNLCIRKATPGDVEALRMMEVEHWQHYGQPPILMQAYHPDDTDALVHFLNEPHNSIWLAMDDNNYLGYLRFDASNSDSVAIVAAPDGVAATGAYVRPQYRGRGFATIMLDAALRGYAGQGFRHCSVDFESFNSEAVSFWLRFFEPVCFSLFRVPEKH
jgi:ribosomal protein S18 acetylase RimI-like enzyme